MKIGIVITSRLNSSRVPNKAVKKLNGLPLIAHLMNRCMDSELPVYLATPENDISVFDNILRPIFGERYEVFVGQPDDPMSRLLNTARYFGLDAVIRVCSDKVFVDPETIKKAAQVFEKKNLDYLYSSKFTPGTGFEIISKEVLELACAKYKNVEHVSYAVKSLTKNILDFDVDVSLSTNHRLLIDYSNDVSLIEIILSTLGSDVDLVNVLEFMNLNKWASAINKIPDISIYTCAYNAEQWIDKCMGSVAMQRRFADMEYILVDDHSIDLTPALIGKFMGKFKNVKFVRNSCNKGLAYSSNVALGLASGKYIMRVDADDYLLRGSIDKLLLEIESSGKDAIYPNNYFGSFHKIQNGKVTNHVGGAIFRRSAVNHIKFTEELRGHEGLDFFLRAKNQINVGYLNEPLFLYRQHSKSLSKNNLSERAKIRAEIENRCGAV